MSEIALALSSVVSLGVAAANTVRTVNVAENNEDAERELAAKRAEERTRNLKATLASQQVALAGQGRETETGTSLILQQQALQAAGREQSLDDFQTGRTISNYQNEAVNAVISGVGSAASTVGSYANTQRQSTKKQTTTPTGKPGDLASGGFY